MNIEKLFACSGQGDWRSFAKRPPLTDLCNELYGEASIQLSARMTNRSNAFWLSRRAVHNLSGFTILHKPGYPRRWDL